MSDLEGLSPEELQAEYDHTQRLIELETKNSLKNKLAFENFQKKNKIQTFTPSAKQEEFIKQAHCKYRGVFAGNRFGKSTIGVVEDCCFALGFRPFYSETHPLRYHGIPTHGVKMLVIAEDWDKVDEIFTGNEPGADQVGKFFEWLPEGVVSSTEKNNSGVISVIHVQSKVHGRTRKSSIWFETVKSFSLNPRSVESSDWDAIHCDEPLPEDMWNAASRGLMDRNGKGWFLLTSLNVSWIFNWVKELASNDPLKYSFIQATTDDNPTLSQEAKDAYFNNLSEEERTARRLGLPLAAGRLVYPTFSRDKHVLKEAPKDWVGMYPTRDYDVVVSIDPHPQTPHAVLFAAIAPTHVIFYSEIFKKVTFSDMRDEEGNVVQKGLASMIRDRTEGCRVQFILCDPTAWIRDPETGRCWADTLHALGLPVIKAPKNKTSGIQEMNGWFSNGFDKKIYVLESLTTWLKEIEGYHYDRDNKPTDRNDHLMEAMYRIASHDHFNYYGEPKFAYSLANASTVNDTVNSSNEFKKETNAKHISATRA